MLTHDGPGYRADLDLPYGVTADDIMDKRKALASGLRRKVTCVWPCRTRPSTRNSLCCGSVTSQSNSETKRPAWPLAKSGKVDLCQPVVFGDEGRLAPRPCPSP